MKNTVIFRVDGNEKTGLGHIYRCIAVADMLAHEFDCSFLMNSGSIHQLIPEKFKTRFIPPSIAPHKEADWIHENADCKDSVLILDGYHFDSVYQKQLKEKGFRLIYIDDTFSQHMYADVVLNHAPEKNYGAYKKETYTKLCLGCDYVMLRKTFLEKAKLPGRFPSDIKSALVSMGGSDEFNLTSKFIEALNHVDQIEKTDVVIGAGFSHTEAVNNLANTSPKTITIHSQLSEKEMADIMDRSDVVFSPSSNTCLELIALKKIIFAGYSADNQLNLYRYFTTEGLVFDLGDLHKISVKYISEFVSKSISKTEDIKKMLALQSGLIDGNSGKRIMHVVEELFS